MELISQHGKSAGLTRFFAGACGCTITNIYLAQPLVGLIGPALGLTPSAVGLTVTLTQVGYGLGLVLLVPLGDLVENRRLVVTTLCGVTIALLLTATAPNAGIFLIAAFLVGLGATATQMLIPIAAHMASDETRGRVIGQIMSGLLIGVLLSRPVSSLLAAEFGWRTVFAVWSAVMLGLMFAIQRTLPRRKPDVQHTYRELMRSLWRLLLEEPVLRRRAYYQALAYGAFSLFWTAIPLRLAQAPMHFDQRAIALFTLAGAAGAFIAPVAGKAGDRGWTLPATGLALAAIGAAVVLASWGSQSVWLLAAAAILLDLGVWSSQVLGQRAIYTLRADARSRINGLFISIFFVGGASGSALAGLSFGYGGWNAVTSIGIASGVIALLSWTQEYVVTRH